MSLLESVPFYAHATIFADAPPRGESDPRPDDAQAPEVGKDPHSTLARSESVPAYAQGEVRP